MVASREMTPHGYHQQPPIVGTCLRCYQPVQGPHVAFPAGPMHPGCVQAEAAQAPPSRKKAPVGVIVAGVAVSITMAALVLSTLRQDQKDYEQRKQQEAAAGAASAATSNEPKERVVFLWCDSAKRFCDPNDRGKIKLYATVGDFDGKDGVWCRGGKRRCIEPSRPLLEVPAGTRAAVLPLEGGRFWSKVRVLDGAGSGKIAIVDEDHVHDTRPP